ncbi:MAG: T9SS type A sorting domain-containing protein, partial [Candidatus Latescibacterota bacterium]
GESNYGGAPNVPHIFMFESLEADTMFWGSYGTTPEDDTDRDYFYWSNFEGEPAQGEGSLLLDWSLFSDEDWGGSSALQHYLPDSTNGEPTPLYDFSDFTHINLWYNTLVPADPPATFRLKMHDASEGLGNAPSSETEDWYSEWSDVFQALPGWNIISIPLESLGNVSPGTGGFSRPGCPGSCWSGIYGNGELDLDQITGFQVEVTGPQFGAVADSSSSGTIVFDNFYVSGVRYNTLESFDMAPADGSHWDNGSGSHTITVVDDTVEGTGAFQLDYNVVADLDWGGSVDMDFSPGTFFDDMTERTHISLFYKVLEPASAPGQVNLTFKVFDNSTGVREEWQYNAGAIYEDTTGNWQRLLIPLKEGEGGLAIPSWISDRGDETLNLDMIDGIQLQLAGAVGTTTSGSILFDRMTGYGAQIVDFEAPAAVEGLSVTASEYSNIVSWNDVPDEEGETYDIFASANPIDDISAEGVMVLERGVAEDTEVYIHNIYAPKVDQEVSYYYAITASDAVGNVSDGSSTESAVSNMAKGIETISLAVPDFAADGDLGEWEGITPIHIEPGTDFGNIPDNFSVAEGGEDLAADVYLAIDDEAVYFGADVTDDFYAPIPEGHETNRWTFDVIEFYFGFYDGRAEEHEGFGSDPGEQDLQINFYGENVLVGDPVAVAGDGSYLVTETETGYNIEAKLTYEALGVSGFTPQNGMRVPMDIVIMDNDVGGQDGREGILTYSPFNNDNSYLSPRNWLYTWIGDKMSVGVERLDSAIPESFALDQNYPNPFNPSTVIRYQLAQQGGVTLKVFNMLGQEVTTLVDAEQAAGVYEVRFDASDLASGLYLYQLQAGDKLMSKAMLLTR